MLDGMWSAEFAEWVDQVRAVASMQALCWLRLTNGRSAGASLYCDVFNVIDKYNIPNQRVRLPSTPFYSVDGKVSGFASDES